MTKKKWTMIFVLIFILLGYTGVTMYTGVKVFEETTQLVTSESTKGMDQEHFDKYHFDYDNFSSKYEREKVTIPSSFDDHTIPGEYIYAKESKNDKNHQTVLLIHGLSGNRYSNYPFAEYFLEKGFNVITYDQRSTNENKAEYTTFGYFEKYDVFDWVDYIEQHAPGQKIGIWSTSFGAATAGLALGQGDIEEKIEFLVMDSPVSNMHWMIEEGIEAVDIKLPVNYMVMSGNIINKIKLGFTYQDADVKKALKDVEIPIFIINSKKDSITPYSMGEDLYEADPNHRELWTVDDSKHFQIWVDHKQKYIEKMDSFLENNY